MFVFCCCNNYCLECWMFLAVWIVVNQTCFISAHAYCSYWKDWRVMKRGSLWEVVTNEHHLIWKNGDYFWCQSWTGFRGASIVIVKSVVFLQFWRLEYVQVPESAEIDLQVYGNSNAKKLSPMHINVSFVKFDFNSAWFGF